MIVRIFFFQSMQLLLPILMNLPMLATTIRKGKRTLGMCTLWSGWKTLMRYVTWFTSRLFLQCWVQKSFVLLVMVIRDHGLVDELVSVWLHIDLQVDLTKETLMKQFQIVKEETNTSHVMQYGDMVYLFYMKRIRPPTPSSFPDYSAVPIYTPGCMVRVKCLV